MIEVSPLSHGACNPEVAFSVGQQYWSSTNNGIKYYYANFDSSGINMDNTNNGNNSRQWRCVSR